jgi:hypothetical protein
MSAGITSYSEVNMDWFPVKPQLFICVPVMPVKAPTAAMGTETVVEKQSNARMCQGDSSSDPPLISVRFT